MPDPPDPDIPVGLVLVGAFEPDDLTRQLGLPPTQHFLNGTPRSPKRMYPTSSWRLESDSAVDAATIEPHLDWLLDKIEPKAAEIRSFVSPDIHAEIDCMWSSVGMGGGPWIPAGSMSRLGALGLPLVISFFAVDPSDAGNTP